MNKGLYVKKKVGLLLVFLIPVCMLPAIDVDDTELMKAARGSVEFLNYEGARTRSDSREEVIGIGIYLAREILDGKISADYYKYYSVRHIVEDASAAGGEEFRINAADVLLIGPSAGVDHVKTIRLILAGYISEMYGYEFDDAYLLAEFATLYNAVYRGNTSFFQESYNPMIIEEIPVARLGMSTRYYEWKGNAALVIPLTTGEAAAYKGPLQTAELSGEEVIDSLRAEEDMGIEERQGIVELKEKELAAAEDRLEEEKAAVTEEAAAVAESAAEVAREKEETELAKARAEADKAELAARQEELDRARQQAAEEERRLEAARVESERQKAELEKEQESIAVKEESEGTTPAVTEMKAAAAAKEEELKRSEEETAARSAAAEARQAEITREEQAAAEKAKQLAEQEAAIARTEAETAEKEAELETKMTELEEKSAEIEEKENIIEEERMDLQGEREAIAEDQQKLIDEGKLPAAAEALYILFLRVTEKNGIPYGTLTLIDGRTGIIEKDSGQVLIKGRRYLQYGNAIYSLTEGETGETRLIMFDGDDLIVNMRSNFPVYGNTDFILKDGMIYAVVGDNGRWAVGEFDTKLTLKRLTAESVLPFSSIAIEEKLLLVQISDDQVATIDLDSLVPAEK